MAITLIDAATSTRESEKCVEEAIQAAARAEKSALEAKKAMVDLVMLVDKDFAQK